MEAAPYRLPHPRSVSAAAAIVLRDRHQPLLLRDGADPRRRCSGNDEPNCLRLPPQANVHPWQPLQLAHHDSCSLHRATSTAVWTYSRPPPISINVCDSLLHLLLPSDTASVASAGIATYPSFLVLVLSEFYQTVPMLDFIPFMRESHASQQFPSRGFFTLTLLETI